MCDSLCCQPVLSSIARHGRQDQCFILVDESQQTPDTVLSSLWVGEETVTTKRDLRITFLSRARHEEAMRGQIHVSASDSIVGRDRLCHIHEYSSTLCTISVEQNQRTMVDRVDLDEQERKKERKKDLALLSCVKRCRDENESTSGGFVQSAT